MLAVALVATFTIVYLTQLGGSHVAPLSLSTGSRASATPALGESELAGKWTVTKGSVAGYRVRETLAFIQSPGDAVGRTSSVTGGITVTESNGALSVTGGSFTVDVSTLTSDQSMRDQRIHRLALESDRYPTATFVLTQPMSLPGAAASGAAFQDEATGNLTIHGVTQQVTIPIEAKLSGSQVELTGSTSFPFERFGMQVPNIAGFVSVVDNATMEFDLRLTQS